MSNLEKEPAEQVCEQPVVERAQPVVERSRDREGISTSSITESGSITDDVEILEPRDVPLGGPRAMGVRRTLPQRARSLIGAWCFVDHYGPERVAMVVPPHPHTGLQTVSWLFAGDIEHRDSVGSHATVRPGQVNLMTAGRGIAHSEVSVSMRPDGPTQPPAQRPVLHGAQLWIALPDSARDTAPAFESHVPQPVELDGARLTVFIGSLAGSASPVTVHTELVGAQLDISPGASVVLSVDARFEHGILVDAGDVTVDGIRVPVSHLAYVAPGRDAITLTAGDEAARVLLIGGVPLGERIIMWWNFIGRTHDEIVGYRDDWMREVIAGGNPHGRFGTVDYDGAPLPAPELPGVRLAPRG